MNLSTEEILLYRVRDISLKRSLLQRICGVGSVLVFSSDKTTPSLELRNIKDSENVKELIHRQVEESKIARRMRISEFMDAQGGEEELDDFDAELL